MIVSKPALYTGFANNKDGKNVGIHEFVHKLDGADGAIDGVPALMMDKDTIPQWLSVIDKET